MEGEREKGGETRVVIKSLGNWGVLCNGILCAINGLLGVLIVSLIFFWRVLFCIGPMHLSYFEIRPSNN